MSSVCEDLGYTRDSLFLSIYYTVLLSFLVLKHMQYIVLAVFVNAPKKRVKKRKDIGCIYVLM